MENTIMMSVAVAASWISSAGLVSAVPALTMLTGYQFVWWQLTLFIGIILYMGLFMAIPLKRQMIQIDSLRFPANIPTGETLKAMYSHGGEAMKKAKALGLAGVLGMLIAGLRDGLEWIPGQVNLGLSIGRINMSKLTLSLEPSLIFIGIGALFGMKVGYSMLLGLILNYGVLAPNLIEAKIIRHAAPQVRAVAAPTLPLEVQAGTSADGGARTGGYLSPTRFRRNYQCAALHLDPAGNLCQPRRPRARPDGADAQRRRGESFLQVSERKQRPEQGGGRRCAVP